MSPRRRSRRRPGLLLALLGVLAAWLVIQRTASRQGASDEPYVAAPPTVDDEAERWRAAARRVEEDRGTAMGRGARVAIPSELRHYRDTRRFLAVQVAAAREQELELPHDDAGLVELIEKDGFVELPPLGDHYILYGVGANASEGPLVHVDARTGASLPLFPRYDLESPKDRRAFRARLLSHLRPAARDLVLEMARDYHERFERPLPLTSLVRSLAYQRQLGETNPNATRIDVPPHSTGLAFDVYYRYMDAEEQEWLMGRFAALEEEGRLEALRERRDHIHALVFPNGERPPESLIAEAIRQRASS